MLSMGVKERMRYMVEMEIMRLKMGIMKAANLTK